VLLRNKNLPINGSRPDMQFYNSYGKLCILDVAFSKDGNDEEYYNDKIRKYKNCYGENNIIPCICRYDGSLYYKSK
jgi:hypothetical protein